MTERKKITELECVGWVQERTKRTLNDFQARVVAILDAISSGIHNAPIRWESVAWEYGLHGVSVVWTRGSLSTFDFCNLTTLVFMCHDARIRLEIEPANMKCLRLSFWQRQHDGRIFNRHPDLDEAIADHRAWLPAEHPLHYRNQESR